MSSFRAYLLVLCFGLLLGLRMGGAHLHLCFDGQEPAAALHVVDAGAEHPGEVGASHLDENIDLAQDGLFKPVKIDLSAVLLAAVVGLFAVFMRPLVPAAARIVDAYILAPAALRPPLRGPPLTARA